MQQRVYFHFLTRNAHRHNTIHNASHQTGGLMCGVGIYCHPNGDRFEGMFFSNKPDGPGSFYERDIYTNNFTGQRRRQLIVLFCFFAQIAKICTIVSFEVRFTFVSDQLIHLLSRRCYRKPRGVAGGAQGEGHQLSLCAHLRRPARPRRKGML